ncbi:MAG TPA: hypothetical protein VFO40_18395 [Chthoniobacterales bacterium]|nr:hypothetical protein [Chthoniobacterales bacterium]
MRIADSEASVTMPAAVCRHCVQLYKQRVRPWIAPYLQQKSCQAKHPVYDFLFQYYSFRPGQLARWSPGPDVTIEAERIEDLPGSPDSWERAGDGWKLVTFPIARHEYLEWAIRFLETTAGREASFCCFGLHEWAMVYCQESIRHSEVPLRLERSAIVSFVDSQSLACTHFDAFRFFTEPARKRNHAALRRETTTEMDQAGCIHVNMDLYRFCYKIAPWIDSNLLADAFGLARFAREIDMRASPYNLREFGFEPICVETAEGRAEYVRLQRKISEQARPIRDRVLEAYRRLSPYRRGSARISRNSNRAF